MMKIFSTYKEKTKRFFRKKPNYKELYEQERREAERWEFKYNKLYRQLNAIIKDSNNG